LRFVAVLVLLGCVVAQAADMIEIRYQDREADGMSYQTRILVTDLYLRMDDGRDEGDFALLERKTGKATNVMHDRRMLMAMHHDKLPKNPPHTYRVEKKVTQVRPGTARVQVLADGKLCSETVAADKLFPDAARAMAQYRAALSYTQWTTYRNTPAELRQDCDLVQHVWQTGMALSHGLPIEERDYSGRVRQYLGGEKRKLRPELFRLPGDYDVLELPDIEGEGAADSSQPSAVQTR
jgi:hypothetical protein